MKAVKLASPALRVLLAGGATLPATGFYVEARAEAFCRGKGSTSQGDCAHANAGTAVSRPVQPNVTDQAAAPFGEIGFSISIDGPDVIDGPDGAADPPPQTIAGAPARPDRTRDTDRALDLAGIDLTYDGLGARPRLAIATTDLRAGFMAGEAVGFRASSNYPDWIAKAKW